MVLAAVGVEEWEEEAEEAEEEAYLHSMNWSQTTASLNCSP